MATKINPFLVIAIIGFSAFLILEKPEIELPEWNIEEPMYAGLSSPSISTWNTPLTSTGGGGGSGSGSGQEIMNIKICPADNTDCSGGLIETNSTEVCIYWEVNNGVGCCATYDCNYTLFYNACLKTGFGLWELSDDKVSWNPYSIENYIYDYDCNDITPWHQDCRQYEPGAHEITIRQKDCIRVVDSMTVKFRLDTLDNKTYYLSHI